MDIVIKKITGDLRLCSIRAQSFDMMQSALDLGLFAGMLPKDRMRIKHTHKGLAIKDEYGMCLMGGHLPDDCDEPISYITTEVFLGYEVVFHGLLENSLKTITMTMPTSTRMPAISRAR